MAATIKNRAGRFWLSQSYVESGKALALFQELQFVPLQSSAQTVQRRYQFVGLSPRFTTLGTNEAIPRYAVEWEGAKGEERLTVERVDGYRLKAES